MLGFHTSPVCLYEIAQPNKLATNPKAVMKPSPLGDLRQAPVDYNLLLPSRPFPGPSTSQAGRGRLADLVNLEVSRFQLHLRDGQLSLGPALGYSGPSQVT